MIPIEIVLQIVCSDNPNNETHAIDRILRLGKRKILDDTYPLSRMLPKTFDIDNQKVPRKALVVHWVFDNTEELETRKCDLN